MQQGNKNQLHSNVNQLGIGPLGNKSPNLQSPPQSLPNSLGMNSMNSMPMSIANNGTQPMNSMQGMHTGVQGSGVGGMIMTNSNMGSMGNVQMAGGLVVKQQGGNMLMNPNNMQPNNQQGMHHSVHQNSIQNGPMGMARMNMQQSHMPGMQRGILNQHMINSQRMVVQQQQVGQMQ